MTRAPVALALALALLCACAVSARADDTRPATLHVEAEGRDTFAVRWQTPVLGTATLRLSPRFPAGARRVEGSYERALLGDSLVETWRIAVPGGLAGREVGVAGPGANVRSTVVFLRLGSGAIHRAVLSGARTTMQVPEPTRAERPHAGTRIAAAARDGLVQGSRPAHALLVLVLVGLFGWRGGCRALALFAAAQLLGALLSVPRLAPGLATGAVALAAVVLARELWVGQARRGFVLAALAGLATGAAYRAGDLPTAVAWTVGTDGLHLLIAGLGALFFRSPARRAPRIAWVLPLGAGAAAVAIVAVLAPSARAVPAAAAAPTTPMALVASEAGGPARVQAVQGMDVFLDIGVFETRVEILGRLGVLARWLETPLPAPSPDMPGPALMPAAAQAGWLDAAGQALAARMHVRIDQAPAAVREARAAFTTSDAAGVYLRERAVDETVAEAIVGFVWFHATDGVPREVTLAFDDLPEAPLGARVIDPEISRDAALSAETARIVWRNALRDDPLPPIEAVALRRVPVRVPALALGVLLAAAFLAWRLPGWRTLVPRVALAAAALLAGTALVALPGLAADIPAATPAEQQAVTRTLLDNLYRAFNERGEDEVYDRLALSLVGDDLEAAYVETQRLLAERRFGGARTHVDVVELHTLDNVVARDGGGFEADATWTVAGTVTHFGHRHLRRNRYEARIAVAPQGEAWKIHALDVRATTREK